MRVWMVLVFALFSNVAFAADAPALEVVKLKPGSGAARSAVDKQVDTLLSRIADKETGEISDKTDFETIVAMDELAVARLNSVLRDQNARFDHRWVAARALGRIGGTVATKSLRTSLSEDKFSMVRLACIKALSDLNDAGSTDAFVKALQDDAMVVRSAAADALGKIGDPKAVDPLIQALDHEDSFYKGRSLWVRRHIVSALGAIESRAAVGRLVKALDDQDPSVKSEAIVSLEKCTKVSFRVPATNDEERVTRAAPKWKSWWEENKKDYL